MSLNKGINKLKYILVKKSWGHICATSPGSVKKNATSGQNSMYSN